MCKIKETNNNVMKENIKESIKECVKTHIGLNNDKTFIPCNFIRKTYGVSIWDYKLNDELEEN